MRCDVGLVLAILLLLTPVVADAQEEPLTALERFQAGEKAYGKRDYAAARMHFERFLEDFGDAEEAAEAVATVRPLLAICLIRTREFAEASEAIDQVLGSPDVGRGLRLELTFWKGVCQLQSQDYAGSQVSFGTYFKEAPSSDPRRMETAVLFGTGYILQEQYPEAIAFLEARVADFEESAPELAARLMTLQLHALLQMDELDRAVELTARVAERFDQFVQIIGLQSLVLELGSRLLEGERFYSAIRCFHYVWSHERLITLQTSRQEKLEKRIRTLKARGNADAVVFQLEGVLTRIKRELEHFSKVVNYDAALRMRLASAYLGLQRYREAALIMEEMLGQMEPNEIVESASVTLVQCWMQEERWERAAQAADLYLERFGPDAPSAATVLFMKGQAWQSARRYEEALAVFEDCLSRYPKNPMTSKAFFMRGICQLQLDRYPEAITVFREVPVAYPKQSALAESALYWEGMAHSFAGEPIRCLELMRRHGENYSEGYYRTDAEFRIAFSEHAMADYGAAISSFRKFLNENGDSTYADEARLLLGDAHLAIGELEEGMASYAAITPESVKFFEEGYFKTGKALKLSERFAEMQSHYQMFIDAHAKSARLPEALHWLAWLKQREGDLDGARTFYWQSIDQYGDEATMPAVLDLILGVQKLYSGADRAVLVEAWAERRAKASQLKRPTMAVRSLWGQALAMKPTQPVQAKILMTEMVPELDPEIHSARLLVDAADALNAMNSKEEAVQMYREITKWHPLALERDRAEMGLGRAAMRKKEFVVALEHFHRVETRGTGTVRLGEILLDKAQCQAAMGDRKEALATLDTLLADKTASSGSKAQALMQSGEWLVADNELQKALVYFERIYLVYARDAALVATAYWSRGQLLEKLGQNEKARELYSELVSREELKDYPEYALAQERVRL